MAKFVLNLKISFALCQTLLLILLTLQNIAFLISLKVEQMKQPRLFINLIVIIILAFVNSGLSVTSAVELAQAAPAANIPLQQGTDTDLAITKTNGQASTVPGTTTTYTIVVTNNGPDDDPLATVADTFPAALTGVTWTCSNAGGGTCTNASGSGHINETVDLPVGTSVTFSATGTVSASATGSLVNTATVTSSLNDPTPGNNSATDTDALTPQANLAITKTNGQTSTVPGMATAYTIVVTNNGPSNAPGASVTDTFPGILIGVTWTCGGTGGGTCTAAGSGNINETVNLPVGGSVTFSASGTVSAGATGSLANTAAVSPPGGVTDPTPGNNSATDTDTLTPEANLAINKTNNQNSTVPGTATTYVIEVTNSTGPSNISGATVADTFPGTLTGVAWTCAGTGGGTCPASGSGNINNTVNLPVGSSVTFTATGTVSAGATGSLANTATVTLPGGSSDPNTGNNTDTDTDTLTPQANLAISKTNNQTSTIPGTLTTYTIVVTNSGPSNAPGATVTDNFPAALPVVAWTCAGAGGGTCPASGSNDINETVNLPVGGSVTFSASGTVNASATGSLINIASVSPPGGVTDPTPGNNSATDTDTLTPQANLAISKTNNQTSTVPGTPTTYIITVTNSSGPSDITGATVADTFPSMTGVNWTCTESGSATCPANGSGNINSTVSLPVGTSVTFTATGTVNPGATGSLANTATVTLPVGASDPVPGNNSATDTDTLTPQADLSITKTNGVASLIPGNNTTYTIVVF